MAKPPHTPSTTDPAHEFLARMAESSFALLDLEKRRDRQLILVDDLKRRMLAGEISGTTAQKNLEEELDHLRQLTDSYQRLKQSTPRIVIEDEDDDIPFEYYDDAGNLPDFPFETSNRHADNNAPAVTQKATFNAIVGPLWDSVKGKRPPDLIMKIAGELDAVGISLKSVISHRPPRSDPDQPSDWSVIAHRMAGNSKSKRSPDFTWTEACRLSLANKKVSQIIRKYFHEAADQFRTVNESHIAASSELAPIARPDQSKIRVMPSSVKAK